MTISQCLRQRIQSWVSRRPASVDSVRGFNTSRGPSPRRPDGLARKNIKAPHAARAAARHHHPHRRSFGLSPRANAENFHRVSSGRNCRDPFTRLRNTRVAFHDVTHFLCGVDRGLWLRAYDYVLARIRSKCRCAKRECEKDAHASNRPAAYATRSAYCFHSLIVTPLRILRKLICRCFRPNIPYFGPPENLSLSRENAGDEDWSDAPLLLRSGYLRRQQVSHR